MISSSAALIPRFSAGVSRNHIQKAMAHTMPTAPKIQNVERHEMCVIMNTTRAGAKAPPHLPHVHMAPTARPRQKTHRGHGPETGHESGHGGEKRPPNHNARNDLAGTDPISQPATRHFEKSVGDGKGAEYGAHLHGRQVEVRHDERRTAGDANTVKVSDDGKRANNSQNLVAFSGCVGAGHFHRPGLLQAHSLVHHANE
jgi:hypothetical protein